MTHLVTPICISQSPKLLSQKGEQKSKNPCKAHLEWWIPVIPITSLFPRGEEDGTHAWDIRCYDDRFAAPSKADVKNPGISASLPSKVTPVGLSESPLRRKNPAALTNQPASNGSDFRWKQRLPEMGCRSILRFSKHLSSSEFLQIRCPDLWRVWSSETDRSWRQMIWLMIQTFLYFGSMESRNLAPSQTTDHEYNAPIWILYGFIWFYIHHVDCFIWFVLGNFLFNNFSLMAPLKKTGRFAIQT